MKLVAVRTELNSPGHYCFSCTRYGLANPSYRRLESGYWGGKNLFTARFEKNPHLPDLHSRVARVAVNLRLFSLEGFSGGFLHQEKKPKSVPDLREESSCRAKRKFSVMIQWDLSSYRWKS